MQNLSPIRLAFIGILVLACVVLLASLFFVFLGGRQGTEVELTANGEGSPPETLSGPAPSTIRAPKGEEPLQESGTGVQAPSDIRVYIAGAVRRPDVYSLGEGDRLVDAVAAAGGPAENADLEAVNLALRIRDEGYYYIPSKPEPPEPESVSQSDVRGDYTEPRREVLPTPAPPPLAADSMTGELPGSKEQALPAKDETATPINLNTAGQAELETLPGIGPARAAAIIGYREQHGPFTAIEELTAVSGIGQGILDNLRHFVTVGQ